MRAQIAKLVIKLLFYTVNLVSVFKVYHNISLYVDNF